MESLRIYFNWVEFVYIVGVFLSCKSKLFENLAMPLSTVRKAFIKFSGCIEDNLLCADLSTAEILVIFGYSGPQSADF